MNPHVELTEEAQINDWQKVFISTDAATFLLDGFQILASRAQPSLAGLGNFGKAGLVDCPIPHSLKIGFQFPTSVSQTI